MVLTNEIYEKIRILSNKQRFEIFRLVSDKEHTISELSSKLNLSYNRCRDYVTIMEQAGLVGKEKRGRSTYITAKILFSVKERS